MKMKAETQRLNYGKLAKHTKLTDMPKFQKKKEEKTKVNKVRVEKMIIDVINKRDEDKGIY